MHRWTRSWSVLGAGALMATLVVGAPVAAADPPTTLRLATPSGNEGPIADLIRSFADQVAADSAGSLTIEPVWQAQGDLPDGGDDRAVANLVATGATEMALVPSRGFDETGTTALEALQTPFLIDNDALAAAVVTGAIGAGLLDGLDAAGLVGLTMWPDGLRHLLTFARHPEPFTDPAQLAGLDIRSVTSEVSWSLLEGYGATVTQKNNFNPDDYDGEEQGLDGRGEPGKAGTGNVTLFPRVQVLVVDDAPFARLTAAQQAVLRAAAAALQARGIARTVPEADAAAQFCADGGRIVLATDAQVAAFLTGAQPVIDALTQGEQTRDAVAAITALKASTPPAPGAAACEPAAQATPVAGDSAWVAALPPDGTYRAQLTYDDLVANGATKAYALSAETWTWIVKDGVSTFSFDPARPCSTSSTLDAHVVHLEFLGDPCDAEVVDLQWEPTADGIHVTVLALDPASSLANERAALERDWQRIE